MLGFQIVGLPDFRTHSKSGSFANQPLFNYSKFGRIQILDHQCKLILAEIRHDIQKQLNFDERQKKLSDSTHTKCFNIQLF